MPMIPVSAPPLPPLRLPRVAEIRSPHALAPLPEVLESPPPPPTIAPTTSRARPRAIALAGLAVALAVVSTISSTTITSGAALVPAVVSGLAEAPTVRYEPQAGRSLIFVNNPEQLRAEDLADARHGAHAIYRDRIGEGAHRAFFEHLNVSGRTIGYGVSLTNPGSTPLEVRVGGQGFEASMRGGEPLRAVLRGEGAQAGTRTLAPGERMYLMRRDQAVRNLAFFSGAVDFEVRGGEAVVEAFAHEGTGEVPRTLGYLGYVQRTEVDGTRESRMYKGHSPTGEVLARDVDFTLDDSVSNGTLPVWHETYDLDARAYRPPSLSEGGWFTHIGPRYQERAVTRDMAVFDMPGWGRVDATEPTDGTSQYPNLGNWGIVYTVEGKVANHGTCPRRVTLNLIANPRHGASFAWRNTDQPWAAGTLTRGERMVCDSFVVAPGQTRPYRASFVLGGPSGGNLRQFFTVSDVSEPAS